MGIFKLSSRAKQFPQPPPSIVLSFFLAVALLQFPVGFLIHGFSTSAGIIINEVVIMLLLPLIGIRLAGYNPINLLPFGKTKPQFLLAAILLTLANCILLSYLQFLSELIFPINDAMRLTVLKPLAVHGSVDFFFKMALLCLLVPICEEIFFRGIVQRTFARYVGKNYAILITAVFFAFMHPSSWHPHLYFILGLMLSWISAKTRTLRTPILCHMLNNTFILISTQRGISFPVEQTFGMLDLLTILAAISLASLAIYLLKRSKRRG